MASAGRRGIDWGSVLMGAAALVAIAVGLAFALSGIDGMMPATRSGTEAARQAAIADASSGYRVGELSELRPGISSGGRDGADEVSVLRGGPAGATTELRTYRPPSGRGHPYAVRVVRVPDGEAGTGMIAVLASATD